MYCQKCKSQLFPEDDNYIKATGVCSYCVTYDKTGNLQQIYNQAQAQKKGKKNDRNKKPTKNL